MQQATIVLNGVFLAVAVGNFIRVNIGESPVPYSGEVTILTIAASALFMTTIAAAIATAGQSFGSYARIAAMTAIIGHIVVFLAALFGLFPGTGTGDGWEPLMLLPMAVSAISVSTLVRNVRP